MVRCSDQSLYTGITTNVSRRLTEHNTNQKGARYTKARRPVTLAYLKRCRTRASATSQEAALKKLTRREKEQLISGW